MALPEVQSAKAVGSYLALSGEVRTEAIVDACRRAGRRVCVPAFRQSVGRYELAELSEGTHVARGRLNVMEPEAPEWVDVRQVDVLMIPGVAFDVRGGRIGRGGGHYDRLLGLAERLSGAAGGASMGARPVRIALAFEFQVFDRVPLTEQDRGMDIVVTEERWFRACADDASFREGGVT